MIAVRPNLRSVVDHDGAIILDIDRDLFISMNPIGAYIWERLVKGDTSEDIAATIASDTGSNISIVSADVAEFMADLKDKHLIELHA
ncbi:PqqD family protein [Acidicapsa ligni]|uniref:PqqD family protein n=1 Tax=Acidicapsa ligni TaxID=542300 RepID=UPI0021E0AF55|nr:PqqD family protein [Acidicapsa ligni]